MDCPFAELEDGIYEAWHNTVTTLLQFEVAGGRAVAARAKHDGADWGDWDRGEGFLRYPNETYSSWYRPPELVEPARAPEPEVPDDDDYEVWLALAEETVRETKARRAPRLPQQAVPLP